MRSQPILFSGNVNLGNYSSWSVIWSFCVTLEELESFTDLCDFTTLRQKISSPLNIYQFVYAVCNVELWLSLLWSCFLFKHSFQRKSMLFKRVAYSLNFVILSFFHSWTVRFGTPPVRPCSWLDCRNISWNLWMKCQEWSNWWVSDIPIPYFYVLHSNPRLPWNRCLSCSYWCLTHCHGKFSGNVARQH